MMKPGEGAFNNPSRHAQTATMLSASSSQDGGDAAPAKYLAVPLAVIPPVALKRIRASSRASALAGDGRNRVDETQQPRRVMSIGTGQLNSERNALRIRDRVVFRAVFPPIRRIWAGFCPPKTARTEALSTTARDQSILSAACSFARRPWCSLSHTPALCQSRKHRQQVMPLPQPISFGRSSHPMPVLRTKRMPVRALRFGTGGRPPLGRGFGGGNNGSIIFQSSSVTSGFAMSFSFPISVISHRLYHRIIKPFILRFC